mgnify:CR=1 FL=1
MKKFIWKNMDLVERTQALARPYELSDPSKVELVKNILLEVKLKGDDAVKSFTSMYDNVNLVNLRVANEDLESAWLNLPKKEKNAIKVDTFDYQTNIRFIVNKHIKMHMTFHTIMDDDASSKVQFRQLFGLGVNYNFHDKIKY